MYWKVNVEGTKSVLAAAVAVGVRKFVYTSTAAVEVEPAIRPGLQIVRVALTLLVYPVADEDVAS